jgi:YD repeat-containing protein
VIRLSLPNSLSLLNSLDVVARVGDPGSSTTLHTYDYTLRASDHRAGYTENAADAQLYAETPPCDARGRTDYKDTAGRRLDYGYYANNLLEDVVSSNADGVNIGYRYDEANRLAFVDDASTGIPAATTSYTYNANGSLATMATPNGVTHTYAYDTLNRLRTHDVVAGVGDPGSSTTLHTYDYTLRASGHRAGYTENATRFANAATRSYQYDDLYRLTGETIVAGVADPGLSGTVTYDLDKVGNRLNRTSSVANVTTRSDTYNNRDLLDSGKTNGVMSSHY